MLWHCSSRVPLRIHIVWLSTSYNEYNWENDIWSLRALIHNRVSNDKRSYKRQKWDVGDKKSYFFFFSTSRFLVLFILIWDWLNIVFERKKKKFLWKNWWFFFFYWIRILTFLVILYLPFWFLVRIQKQQISTTWCHQRQKVV